MGFIELVNLGLPIIAVLNGKVYGGGLPIALWCDYRIATKDVDMHFGNLSRGMSPAGQLSQLLRDYLSPSEIMETYLENSHWDCNDLLRLKIVSSVVLHKEDAMFQAKQLAAFIAKKPSEAVRDTLHLVKLKYAAEVADKESWLIAKKITGSKALFHQSNESFSFNGTARRRPNTISKLSDIKSSESSSYGIIAFEVYTPAYAVAANTLEQEGIPANRKHGQDAVALWDTQEDSISMALNAVAALLKNHVSDPYSIGRLEVGTESNVDMAKSIKSYLMDLFPSDHLDIEGVDNINACYGGAAALLNTISWCRETCGYGIVVACDTADMDLQDSAWRGASAVAMLVGPDPWVEIHERVSCFKNTHDFLKPRYSTKITPYMHTKDSMNHYIESLDSCIESISSKFSVDVAEADAFVFHGGLCISFVKLVERHLIQANAKSSANNHWNVNFEYARCFAAQMGGLYTASLFVNLLSLLHGNASNDDQASNDLNEIYLFAYGSGSTSTLMRASIHKDRSHNIGLPLMLQKRQFVSYDMLSQVVNSHKVNNDTLILPKIKDVYYKSSSHQAVADGSMKREYHVEKYTHLISRDQVINVENHNHNFLDFLQAHKRQFAAAALWIGWSWWLIASIVFQKYNTKELLFFASVTFIVMAFMNVLLRWYFKRGYGWTYMLGHYITGLFQMFGYIIILISFRGGFQTHLWRSIYLGWYSFDSLFFVVCWNLLAPTFCTFQSIHHSLSLLCTGTWLAVGGDWSLEMIVAVTIWLTSDIWYYSLNLYRYSA